MPTIEEGQLRFEFPDDWEAEAFDDWSFYRNQFQSTCGGAKAVDILAIDAEKRLWLIEVKDYRQNPRTKTIDLPLEVAQKVRDTLAALLVASIRANDPEEKEFAQSAMRCENFRIVLHLEQPRKHSKLFPRSVEPANIIQSLKQLIRAVDPHPKVLDIGDSEDRVEWSVR